MIMVVSCAPRGLRITNKMWIFIYLCAFVCISVSAGVGEQTMVLHKCCPENQCLIRVSDSEESIGDFECIEPNAAKMNYSVTITPLVTGKKVHVEYGIPEQCDSIQMEQVTANELDIQLTNFNDQCYDRLVIEIINDTMKSYIPKIVSLTCLRNQTEQISDTKLHINQFRKCCPNGQSFDSKYHLCRNTTEYNDENWLLKRLKARDDEIFEVDTDLICKADEFAVELREEKFSLELEGSNLRVENKNEGGYNEVLPGEWCLDREHDANRLVARVCTRDCKQYGAFCIKKCCPIGHHYLPVRKSCGFASKCVPNDDEVPFNITDYLEPLMRNNAHISDVMGFGTGLTCPVGRIVLDKSLERDRHYLGPDARLFSPISVGYDYCIESFDRRGCTFQDIMVTAANCFIGAPVTKDFSLSFILITVSSACLLLTLVVYVSLPELRNLHGRTLICHVSMMLLAYGCLARVQRNLVSDNTVCTLLGYGIYFGFVAAFAWLNVMCFDIWWTFGSVRTVQPMRKASAEFRRFVWYSLYAWGLAVLLTLIMFLFDRYPVVDYLDANIGDGMCWFGTLQNSQSDWPHYIFFVIPMGFISCVNFILWVLTARHCARVKSEVHRLQAGSVGDRVKRRFRVDRAKYVLTGKLWVVMGAGWISELLSTLTPEPQWLWNLFDLINEIQGVFIFLILVIKPKLFYLVRKRLGLEKPDAQKNGASSSARTSSTFLSRTISTDERALTRLSAHNNVKQS